MHAMFYVLADQIFTNAEKSIGKRISSVFTMMFGARKFDPRNV